MRPNEAHASRQYALFNKWTWFGHHHCGQWLFPAFAPSNDPGACPCPRVYSIYSVATPLQATAAQRVNLTLSRQ